MTGQRGVGAAVDIGSNSVHLLVASIGGGSIEPLVDESSFLGLGHAAEANAHLGPALRDELGYVLATYRATATGLGASAVTLLGTEPLRRAADGARVIDDVGRATGLPLHVLSHEEEAYLTVVGVTGGRPVERATLVVDIGGGSSEFCLVSPERDAIAAGLRLGSSRLSTRYGTTDPLTREAVDAMRVAADEILTGAIDFDPADLYLVGGTATNLLKVTVAGLTDPTLSPGRIGQALDALMAEPAGATAARFGINPKRAALLPAGAVIVEALMHRYDAASARVSQASLREGAILATDHVGRGWRDRLPALARGWRD